MEYYEVVEQEHYIPQMSEGVSFVAVNPEDINDEEYGEEEEEEEPEYKILDISSRPADPLSHEHQEDTVYTEESQDEQECHSDGNYDENEEEQGVLQHKWENEDPAQESEEETVMNKELKAQMSNLVKFINFLNRLMEDHQNFVNSDINAEVIDSQRKNVVLDAHMISDFVETIFDNNIHNLNEIIYELKKLLAVKVEIFDKLYDKQVNGAVSSDVVKRLFSGNNMLVRTQIEELRRILFAKLDAANKMHLINVQKIEIAKQAKRRAFRPVEVLKKVKKRPKHAKTIVRNVKIQSMSIQEERKQKMNSTLDVIRNLEQKKTQLQNHIDKLNKLEDISAEMENLIKAEFEIVNTECKQDEKISSLGDFDSFTQVVSKKLNLKPEEASPSSILSKFRNNLNKKLQRGSNGKYNVPETEFIVDNIKEEEYIVEEVFFDDMNPEDMYEDENEAKPSTYNINDITLTKVPNAPPSSKQIDNSFLMKQICSSKPSNVLHNLDIEKVLLKDRTKALLQIHALDTEPDPYEKEKAREKRQALQDLLYHKLEQLEADATLAKKCLFSLDIKKTHVKKGRPQMHRLENPVTTNFGLKRVMYPLSSNTIKPLKEIEEARKNMDGGFIPYVVEKAKKDRNYCVFVDAEERKSDPTVLSKTSDDLDEKLKALFKNNNLKGKLMKQKIIGSDESKERKLEGNANQDEIDCKIENQPEEIPNKAYDTVYSPDIDSKVTRGPCRFKNRATTKRKKAGMVVHEVTLPRKVKRDKKPKLNLPGESSKLFFLRLKNSDLLRGSRPLLKPPNDCRTFQPKAKRDGEKLDKSKQLLERLKQQIFDKLHQQEKVRNTVDVKLELENRLRKRGKLRK